MNKVHSIEFRVRLCDVDFRGRAAPLTVLDYLQEAAGEHAALLGVSVLDLRRKNVTWVLSRYHVRMSRFPGPGESVVVRTWPSGKKGVFALRDFEAFDGEGRALFAATSSWVMIDVATKQPLRLDGLMSEDVNLEKRAVPDDFPTLPVPGAPDREVPFRVNMLDIDFNNHATHTVYIQWALETPPENVLRTLRPASVEVTYKAEAGYGDKVIASAREANESEIPAIGGAPRGRTFIHAITNAATGKELAHLRTVWSDL